MITQATIPKKIPTGQRTAPTPNTAIRSITINKSCIYICTTINNVISQLTGYRYGLECLKPSYKESIFSRKDLSIVSWSFLVSHYLRKLARAISVHFTPGNSMRKVKEAGYRTRISDMLSEKHHSLVIHRFNWHPGGALWFADLVSQATEKSRNYLRLSLLCANYRQPDTSQEIYSCLYCS